MTQELAFPKPGPKLRAVPERPNKVRETNRRALELLCDAACGQLVKRLAGNRCECGCNGRPTPGNPLDCAHGVNRDCKALRWAHTNTFALLRGCHDNMGRNRGYFLDWRKSMVSALAWERIQQLGWARPKPTLEQLQAILAGLRRGVFVQGAR